MTKVFITKHMLDQLEYDNQKMSQKTVAGTTVSAAAAAEPATPTVMFVFAGADLNAAAYHLAKSLTTPFAANAVATLLVQEAVRADFISKLQPQLPTYDKQVTQHAGFLRALDIVARLKANTITAGAQTGNAATLVCDLTHEQLGLGATGLVTVHTFRTAKEAIALCAKESISFNNATIWHGNHSCAYELVAAVPCRNFYINCYQVSLETLQSHVANGSSFVSMDKNYHYETLPCNGLQKSVVFPIGTIFAN